MSSLSGPFMGYEGDVLALAGAGDEGHTRLLSLWLYTSQLDPFWLFSRDRKDLPPVYGMR